MSIENKLTYLEGTKTAIKDAIVAKGVAIDDNATFRSYATAISTIETGGGTEINNQTKTVEINQNGQTTVSYDEGYTGLESVVINTNVPTGSGNCNVGLCFDSIGYTTYPSIIQNEINEQNRLVELGLTLTSNNPMEKPWKDSSIMFMPLYTINEFSSTYDIYVQNLFQYSNAIYIKAPIINSTYKRLEGIYAFSDCPYLQIVDLSNWKGLKPKSFENWFSNDTSLSKVIGIYDIDLSIVTSVRDMFEKCTSLKTMNIDFTGITTPSDYCFNGLFNSCSNLESVNLKALNNLPTLKQFNYVFNRCDKLSNLTIEVDTSNCIEFTNTFASCTSLAVLNGFLSIKSFNKSITKSNFLVDFSGSGFRVFELRDLGTLENITSHDFSRFYYWGQEEETYPGAKQSLIDSLITYSFDRATAGYSACTLKLAANTKAVLTEEEIAQITAKGYTIA